MATSLIARPRFARLFNSVFRTQLRMSSSPGSQYIETESVGNVFLIGINRPEKRNCVNPEMAESLWQTFKEFERNDDYYVAVLYGKGGNFCAGFDLSRLAAMDERKDLPDILDDLPPGRGPMGPSRKIFSKPVIAAVTGYAVAGGLELSLMCDMRIADETAVFGVFCRRFGVPLIDGGTVRLPHLIGLSRAMDLILTGRPVPAKEAGAMGLANKVVPVGAALGEAVNIANNLCKFPQECLRRDRLSAFNAAYNAQCFNDAVDFELKNARHVVSQESVSGAGRFVKGVGKSGSFEEFKSKI